MGRAVSLAMAVVAVLGVFVEIPIVSAYAFLDFGIWYGAHSLKVPFSLSFMLSIVLLIVAIVGVFVEIPIVSDYAFWVLVIVFFYLVGVTG
jgi:hypothetical protein